MGESRTPRRLACPDGECVMGHGRYGMIKKGELRSSDRMFMDMFDYCPSCGRPTGLKSYRVARERQNKGG